MPVCAVPCAGKCTVWMGGWMAVPAVYPSYWGQMMNEIGGNKGCTGSRGPVHPNILMASGSLIICDGAGKNSR